MPERWSVGIIKPIYKNNGDSKLPEIYRPIKILSCIGKLFTAIINKRLNKFSDESELINHANLDKNKDKLLCCFVVLKQAFDSVWREKLWEKLQQHKNEW